MRNSDAPQAHYLHPRETYWRYVFKKQSAPALSEARDGWTTIKILATGGTGCVGANLAKILLEGGHDTRAFVYPGDASRARKLDGWEHVETVEGNLRNLDDVRRAVDGVDALYHLAATFGGLFDNRQYLAIYGMGTLNLLESELELCPNLEHFVYACTEAIYWRLEDRSPHLTGREDRYFPESTSGPPLRPRLPD